MACFLVTAAEAVVVTVIAQAVKKKESVTAVKLENGQSIPVREKSAIPVSRKLMWLAYLLWGGVALLAFEHVWHGEVVPWFPFLTAAASPGDAAEMLHEMSTIGVLMAVLVTAVWGVVAAAAGSIVKRPERTATAQARR